MSRNTSRTWGALFVAVLVLVAGCASGPPFERVSSIPDNRAVIYIFREARGLGAAAAIGVAMNGAPIASLWAGEYAVARVRPGKVLIEARGVGSFREGTTAIYEYLGVPNTFLTVEVLPGREYVVEVDVSWRIRLHATEPLPKNLLSSKYVTDPPPWKSLSEAQAAQTCNRMPRDQAIKCIEALMKQP